MMEVALIGLIISALMLGWLVGHMMGWNGGFEAGRKYNHDFGN